jgi:hypothetical protein
VRLPPHAHAPMTRALTTTRHDTRHDQRHDTTNDTTHDRHLTAETSGQILIDAKDKGSQQLFALVPASSLTDWKVPPPPSGLLRVTSPPILCCACACCVCVVCVCVCVWCSIT